MFFGMRLQTLFRRSEKNVYFECKTIYDNFATFGPCPASLPPFSEAYSPKCRSTRYIRIQDVMYPIIYSIDAHSSYTFHI